MKKYMEKENKKDEEEKKAKDQKNLSFRVPLLFM